MKTALSLLFFITFHLSLFASGNPIELLVQVDPSGRALILQTAAPVKHAATIRIVDADGRILHTSQLTVGGRLNRKFNLAALPPGEYRVTARDAVAESVHPVTISSQDIVADPALATRNYLPRVILKEDLLTVNYLNPEGGKVKIRLADQVGNELMREQLAGHSTIHRAYNLERLPAGAYHVSVYATDLPVYSTRLYVD
ncbi:hypothetical protein GGR26_001586 [Lewinella marina]|uniref:Secretion system C-terminal sorting domain-containing protein n=1 Tax=Neolewinella marina TaxID=438751 RepID=A0A2G0CET4_9BACT|nr:carboxypeptidase regulatory-like domain-containing protein [Neolewinella marina]NJB85841.1 hypothetical protein [Neolewinella marina]PHK98491.1 hypothetical protein CGL56_08410 [Neolewinella marina]